MKIEEMNFDEIAARLGEIAKSVEGATGDQIKALNTETDALISRKQELEKGMADNIRRNALNAKLKAGTLVPEDLKSANADLQERTAFMEYVQTGKMSDLLQRTDVTGVSTDLGVLIPKTVQQEIIKNIDEMYGSLYAKVKHLNIRGGVEYPIGSFSATFSRITESAVSDRQKGGSITGSVVFGYNIGEIRIAQTLLESLLAVPVFEAELAKVIAEAFVKAMDSEILNGTGTGGQMEGILGKAGITTITFHEGEIADWKTIQKKIFGGMSLGFKALPYEFVMSNGTWESQIKTLSDDNNRPVYAEPFNPVDGTFSCSFRGHNVTLVEPTLLPDFDAAAVNKIFGMIWVPGDAYAINSNMNFSVVQYVDHEKNQIVKKALVVNDGKVLRKDRIILLKKVAKPAGATV